MPRTALTLTYEGQTLTLREWARVKQIPFYTIRTRLKAGKSLADVLSTAKHYRRKRTLTTQKTRAQQIADARPWTLDAPRPSTGHRRFLVLDGVRHTYAEWSVIRGVCVGTINERVSRGLPVEEVLKRVPEKRQRMKAKPKAVQLTVYTRMTLITVDGDTRTVERWAYELCIPVAEVLTMLKAGKRVEDHLARRVTARRAPKPAPQPRPRTMGLMHVPTLAEVDAMRRAA